MGNGKQAGGGGGGGGGYFLNTNFHWIFIWMEYCDWNLLVHRKKYHIVKLSKYNETIPKTSPTLSRSIL